MNVIEIIQQNKLLPVFNHPDPVVARRVVKACYDAGLRVFEWTNRGENAANGFAAIREWISTMAPEMVLGAGTIFDGNSARQFIGLGAKFIVSPVLDPEVRDACVEMNVPWIPGTGTVTEIHQAYKWGAEMVKVFPGETIGGPAFVKAVRGPMPWVKIMPTGGVTTDAVNLKDWFSAGVCCVGIGSGLFTPELINQADPEPLKRKIEETLALVRSLPA